MFYSDTIAAISTAMSNSGIGIIRICGDDALEVVSKIFKSVSGKSLLVVKSHTVHYGHIVDGENIIDEVLVTVMKKPHSYTTEDTVEINCHGGVIVVNKVLKIVLKNGARLAEPGEFTKRAFLNGRIDLSQAEAVIDVINAESQYALSSAVTQLKGNVSNVVKDIRDRILDEIAFIETALDDPEHYEMDNYSQKLMSITMEVKAHLKKLIDSADNGRVISEGVKTVILGKPNAGKSSLLNALLGEERAIVTDIAGTTRDTLEENVKIHGISLKLIDTAGIRDTEDTVEKIGVNKAKETAENADLIIYVADASREFDDSDKEILELINGRKSIILLNKSDLEEKIDVSDIRKYTDGRIINISAKLRTGIDELENIIKEMFFDGEIDFNNQVFITNMRQKDDILKAYESIVMVENSINDGMPEDFFTIDLMNAYESLGRVVGEAVEEDLVNRIFSKFCMGK